MKICLLSVGLLGCFAAACSTPTEVEVDGFSSPAAATVADVDRPDPDGVSYRGPAASPASPPTVEGDITVVFESDDPTTGFGPLQWRQSAGKLRSVRDMPVEGEDRNTPSSRGYFVATFTPGEKLEVQIQGSTAGLHATYAQGGAVTCAIVSAEARTCERAGGTNCSRFFDGASQCR